MGFGTGGFVRQHETGFCHYIKHAVILIVIFLYFPQRRLSEPSGGAPITGRTCQRPNSASQNMGGSNNKSRSENEGLDRCNNTWNEIEAGDVRDGMYNSNKAFLFDVIDVILNPCLLNGYF